MPRTVSSNARAKLKKVATTAAVVSAILAGSLVPAGSTGAWFTASKSIAGNTLDSATLAQVSNLSATNRTDGVNVRWDDAQQQTWGTANGVTNGTTYTVTRTIDDADPQEVYTGSSTSFADSFPQARISDIDTTLSAGYNTAGLVRPDGTVWTWGVGYDQSLGTGTNRNPNPVQVTFPGGVAMRSISYTHVRAVTTGVDGSVWMWGKYFHACPGGDPIVYTTPNSVPTPPGRTVVSAAFVSQCELVQLASDGTVWRYADNTLSQVVLPGNRRGAQLTKNTVVLASDGTVWGWGRRSNGQLGDGTTSQSDIPFTSPVQAVLPTGTRVKRVASYANNTIFLLDNNQVWITGWNYDGVLGIGKTYKELSGTATPVQVSTEQGKTWVDVALAYQNASVLASDGKVYVTGKEDQGMLGNGTRKQNTDGQTTPTPVTNPTGVKFQAIALGADNPQAYGVDQNGAIYGWGLNRIASAYAFGNNNSPTTDYYLKPTAAAKNMTYSPGSKTKLCDNGGTVNSSDHCPFPGTVKYAVKYKYASWTAPSESAQATATPVQTGTAVIGGPGSSGKCLTIQGNGSADGTPVVLANCDSSATGQRWTTWSDGTFRANGECLDMKGSTPGTIVQLWNCNGEGYQWWVPRADGSMYNPTSQLCLTDPSGTAAVGTQQQISTCNGSASQQWKLTS